MKNISLLLSLLLIGSASVTVSALPFLAIAGAAAAVVSAIGGVAGPALYAGRPVVTCDIEIENWTGWRLHDQRVYVGGGSVSDTGALVIPQARKTTLMAQKTYGTATGTYGVASWRVGNLDRRIWFMWSVAYDRTFHPKNWLSVGISSAAVTDGASVWNSMYSGSTNSYPGLIFNRRGYGYGTTRPVVINDNEVLIVRGFIGTSRTPKAKIIVRPVQDRHLANAIQARLNGSG